MAAGIFASFFKALAIKKVLGKSKEKSYLDKINIAKMVTDRIKNEFSQAFETGLNDIFLGVDNAIAQWFDPLDEATKTAEEMGATAFDQEDINKVTKAMHDFKVLEREQVGEGLIHVRDRLGTFHGLFPDGTNDNVLKRGYNRVSNMIHGD